MPLQAAERAGIYTHDAPVSIIVDCTVVMLIRQRLLGRTVSCSRLKYDGEVHVISSGEFALRVNEQWIWVELRVTLDVVQIPSNNYDNLDSTIVERG